MYLAQMNWQEAEETLKTKNLVALIPIGSTEQHGPIGPLGTDFIIPDYFARCIEERTEVLVVPTMPFGVATHHVNFPGTIDIGAEALYLVMRGIITNLMHHGVKKFIFINGHGGNTPTLEKVSLEAFHLGGLCSIIDWWSLAPQLNENWRGGHGDGQEVSMILAIDDTLVKKQYLKQTTVSHLSDKLQNTHLNSVKFQSGTIKIIRDVRSVVDTGGFGGSDSATASKKLGNEMQVAIINYCVDFIDEFRTISI